MKVLSLFDGIACGYEALLRAGFNVEKYYASEIDKYAIQIATKNHPDIVEIGDVCNVKGEDYKDVDLLIGGSPCQGFSMAGKMLNFDDPRSKLFFEYVRLLNEIKPKYFLLENVNMKKEWRDIISKEIGVETIKIDSALVSAQSRKRLYRTNIPGVTQPEDKGILIKDILQDNVDEKYYLTEKQIDMINKRIGWDNPIQLAKTGEEKIGTLTTHVGKTSNGLKLIRGRPKMPYEPGHRTLEYKEYIDKTPTLTTSCAGGDQKNIIVQGYNLRKLTPIECERLQTLPDNYTEGVRDTQRYKMLGNGWTVDIITHILKNLK